MNNVKTQKDLTNLIELRKLQAEIEKLKSTSPVTYAELQEKWEAAQDKAPFWRKQISLPLWSFLLITAPAIVRCAELIADLLA